MPSVIKYENLTNHNKDNGTIPKTTFVMPFGTYSIIDELLKKLPNQESNKETDTLFVIPAGAEDLIGLF